MIKRTGSASVTERQPAAAVTAEASTQAHGAAQRNGRRWPVQARKMRRSAHPERFCLYARHPFLTACQSQDVRRGFNGRALLGGLNMLIGVKDH